MLGSLIFAMVTFSGLLSLDSGTFGVFDSYVAGSFLISGCFGGCFGISGWFSAGFGWIGVVEILALAGSFLISSCFTGCFGASGCFSVGFGGTGASSSESVNEGASHTLEYIISGSTGFLATVVFVTGFTKEVRLATPPRFIRSSMSALRPVEFGTTEGAITFFGASFLTTFGGSTFLTGSGVSGRDDSDDSDISDGQPESMLGGSIVHWHSKSLLVGSIFSAG